MLKYIQIFNINISILSCTKYKQIFNITANNLHSFKNRKWKNVSIEHGYPRFQLK